MWAVEDEQLFKEIDEKISSAELEKAAMWSGGIICKSN